MTGKEIINIIQQNGLEDFELKVSTKLDINYGNWGISYITNFIDTMIDIGHSDRTVTFDTKEN